MTMTNQTGDNATVAGSALRHAVTGIVGAAIGGYMAKKGIPLPADATTELGNGIVSLGTAVGAGVAALLGAGFRKLLGVMK